jgi:hypothetical protein
VGFNLTREFNCNVRSPVMARNIRHMLTRHLLQAWVRFVLVWLICLALRNG